MILVCHSEGLPQRGTAIAKVLTLTLTYGALSLWQTFAIADQYGSKHVPCPSLHVIQVIRHYSRWSMNVWTIRHFGDSSILKATMRKLAQTHAPAPGPNQFTRRVLALKDTNMNVLSPRCLSPKHLVNG